MYEYKNNPKSLVNQFTTGLQRFVDKNTLKNCNIFIENYSFITNKQMSIIGKRYPDWEKCTAKKWSLKELYICKGFHILFSEKYVQVYLKLCENGVKMVEVLFCEKYINNSKGKKVFFRNNDAFLRLPSFRVVRGIHKAVKIW